MEKDMIYAVFYAILFSIWKYDNQIDLKSIFKIIKKLWMIYVFIKWITLKKCQINLKFL